MGYLTDKEIDDFRIKMYMHLHRDNRGRNEPRWRGVRILKHPTDLILYCEQIFETCPDYIIETGTAHGGSALFFADMLGLSGGRRVFTIDVNAKSMPKHPDVEYVVGSSSDREVRDRIWRKVKGKKVMVVLDSDHRTRHVARELRLWSAVVTKGQWLVVEDCWTRRTEPFWPHAAVQKFLDGNEKFKREPIEDRFILAISRGGWLKRIS